MRRTIRWLSDEYIKGGYLPRGGIILLLAMTLVIGIIACTSESRSGSDGRVTRWDDPDLRISCWTVWGNGISCLPSDQIKQR